MGKGPRHVTLNIIYLGECLEPSQTDKRIEDVIEDVEGERLGAQLPWLPAAYVYL